MRCFKATIILLVASLTVLWGGACGVMADKTPSLIVHFEPGKTRLNDADNTELHKFFESFALGPRGKVFVVGYTDATGPKAGNRKLARQRAQNVRHAIVADCGIDAGLVITLGQGARLPLADNKTVKGRALNRRVEIFLTDGHSRKPPPPFGPRATHWSEITNQVRQAEKLIKARRIADALQKLEKVHALGAGRYSRWHAVRGIAGYYAGEAPEQTRAHLAAALDLDPYDAEAREYLGRVDARLKFARSRVTREMGRSPETAIVITDIAQQYEYLRLFEVEPQVHRVLEEQPVDMWQCVDRQGAPVVYYFNHAPVFRWALAGDVPSAAPTMTEDAQSSNQDQSRPARAGMQSAPGDGPRRPGRQIPETLWESKLFK